MSVANVLEVAMVVEGPCGRHGDERRPRDLLHLWRALISTPGHLAPQTKNHEISAATAEFSQLALRRPGHVAGRPGRHASRRQTPTAASHHPHAKIFGGRASSPVGRAAFKAVEALEAPGGFDSYLFRHKNAANP